MTNRNPIHQYIPIDTCLLAMKNATLDQLDAIDRLAQKPTVQKMHVRVDNWNEKNLIFALYGNKGPDDVFLVGLIQPDGSVNT